MKTNAIRSYNNGEGCKSGKRLNCCIQTHRYLRGLNDIPNIWKPERNDDIWRPSWNYTNNESTQLDDKVIRMIHWAHTLFGAIKTYHTKAHIWVYVRLSKILIFGGHLRLFSLLYTCTPNHTSNYGYLKEYAPSCKMKPNKGVCAIYCRQCANNLTTWYKTYGTFFLFLAAILDIYIWV